MMISTLQPQCVWAVGTELGEGPVWVEREHALYFVDIDGHRVHRYHPASGKKTSWEMPGPPGFVHPCESGGFLCGLHDGLYAFDERSGTVSRRHAFEEEMHQLQEDLGDEWIVRFSVQNDEAWLTAEKEDGSQHVEGPTADVLREAVELLEGGGESED